MFLPAEFLDEFLPIPPLNQHAPGVVPDQTTRFGGFGKIEFGGEVEDLIGLSLLRPLQPIQLCEVSGVEIRLVQPFTRVGITGEEFSRFERGHFVRIGPAHVQHAVSLGTEDNHRTWL